MDRRRFLMGLGAFAGAAIALPEVPRVIFDMGRARVEVPTMYDRDLMKRLMPVGTWADRAHRGLISQRDALEMLGAEESDFLPEVYKSFNPMTVYPTFDRDGLASVGVTEVTATIAQYGSWVRLSDLDHLDSVLERATIHPATLRDFLKSSQVPWATSAT